MKTAFSGIWLGSAALGLQRYNGVRSRRQSDAVLPAAETHHHPRPLQTGSRVEYLVPLYRGFSVTLRILPPYKSAQTLQARKITRQRAQLHGTSYLS